MLGKANINPKVQSIPGAGVVDVFDLDEALLRDYERFARSFTRIRAQDVQEQVETLYSTDRFWPEPLLSINPRFESGDSIDDLVRGGTLDANTARIFNIDGKTITLHRHQSQAVAKAATGQSFVVTTGTGSGNIALFLHPDHRCRHSRPRFR